MNPLLLRTIAGEFVDRPPVWMMRQAGRILPEYRKMRAEAGSFKGLVQRPEWAAEVTLQPVRRFDVDAAIIFSDILVIPEAMGLDYEIVEKKGPQFAETIKSMADVDRLESGKSAADRLEYVYAALRNTREQLSADKTLIGFSGAPWTLMSYMIQGSGSKNFEQAKACFYGNKELSSALLDKLTESIIAYLKLQIKAGAQVLQLFDSWASHLPSHDYIDRMMPYLKRITDAVQEVPIILFAKGVHPIVYTAMDKLDVAVIGVDWSLSAGEIRKLTRKVLQGNLDPSILLTNSTTVQEATRQMLQDFGPRHIANLGHGVMPMTQLEEVYAFIETVQAHRYDA